ncbi:MAG: transglycosylase SLT domain-containing protein [Oligoflexia bacterium]|nr:transglycosylase SLT domain-containing protein [Oligoflexia bacterium]
MRFLQLTFRRSVLIGCFGISLVAGMLGADPSDDFSFSLHSLETASYRTMSEHRAAQILGDRLDLFPQSKVPELARHIVSLCQEFQFDPAFIFSLIEVESGFRIRVHSPAGAVGLMQLMPATAAVISRERRPEYTRRLATPGVGEMMLTDPFLNTELGIAYLAWLRDRYRDLSPYYLVAAYNIGPAKLDQLLSRKDFKPVNTKRYYEAIRKGLPGFRFYRSNASLSRKA